jgi:hypothetical protein
MNKCCKQILFSLSCILFLQLLVHGQEDPYYHVLRPDKLRGNISHNGETIESSGFSGTGANMDVLYHKIYWRINPDSTKYIKGSVQTNFKTIQNNVSVITFDLRNVLLIDSVIFRGTPLPSGNITRSGNIVSVNLGATLPIHLIDSFIVYYQGVPPAASSSAQGYQKATSSTAGNYITTLSESYEDRDWWPCKADMQDKIDSMDIIVNVPWASPTAADTFWVASNGKLVDSTITGSNRTYVFKNRYPIASYLVFVSVAKYNRYYRSVNVSGTEVPVVYNLFRGKASYTSILAAMDNMNPLLATWSTKFGHYPFKNEKHGYYEGLLGASGMEHQTMSGMATSALASARVLAHELHHQWFGDNVTFGTWNDLWLAEGFARYSEAYAGELMPSLGINPYTTRNNFKNSALSLSTVSAWIPDANIASSSTIWGSSYGSAIYERGGMIVSMLRSISGDTKFFQALTNYQTGLAGKSASTDSLKNYFNRILGRDISAFFNDYVGGSGNGATAVGGIGNPINTINWNSPSDKKLVVQVASQTRTAGSNVSYFRGPVVLHIRGTVPAEDTTITFFDWGGGNLSYAGNGLSIPVAGNRLSYDLPFTPVTVLYDDSARTLSTGSTVNIPGLDEYIWYGAVNTDWNNASNWSAAGVPPSGADITIATLGTNQPVLPGSFTVGKLTINGLNTLHLNGHTLTLNNIIKGTGTLTGSPSSSLVIADAAGIINFDQSSTSARSLNTLTLNPGCSAILGTGQLELFGGLNLPASSSLTVNAANLIIH